MVVSEKLRYDGESCEQQGIGRNDQGSESATGTNNILYSTYFGWYQQDFLYFTSLHAMVLFGSTHYVWGWWAVHMATVLDITLITLSLAKRFAKPR
jgi:hypothetical protein